MSGDQEDSGRAASPRRRRQAREEGHVVRSRELVATVIYAAAVLVCILQGPGLWQLAQAQLRDSLQTVASGRTAAALMSTELPRCAATLVRAVAPFLFALMAAAVLGHWVQHGPLWLPDKLTPNFSRIDPGLAILRCSRSGAGGRLILGLLKCVLLGWIAVRMVEDQLPNILRLSQLPLDSLVVAAAQLILRIAAWLGIGALVSAALDFAWQFWRYERELRMSPEEARDDVKAVRNDLASLRRRPS